MAFPLANPAQRPNLIRLPMLKLCFWGKSCSLQCRLQFFKEQKIDNFILGAFILRAREPLIIFF